ALVPAKGSQPATLGWIGWMGWVAAAALVVGCSVLFGSKMKTENTLGALKSEAEQSRLEADTARGKLKDLEGKLAELMKGSPRNQKLIRLGPPEAPSPGAVVAWDQEKQRGTLLIDGLPA